MANTAKVKFARGVSSTLPSALTEGKFYLTVDDGKFYVDAVDNAGNKIKRYCLNPESDWNASSGLSEIKNKPTKLSQFDNDEGFATKDDIEDPIKVSYDGTTETLALSRKNGSAFKSYNSTDETLTIG